jgi:hypothetical protein
VEPHTEKQLEVRQKVSLDMQALV